MEEAAPNHGSPSGVFVDEDVMESAVTAPPSQPTTNNNNETAANPKSSGQSLRNSNHDDDDDDENHARRQKAVAAGSAAVVRSIARTSEQDDEDFLLDPDLTDAPQAAKRRPPRSTRSTRTVKTDGSSLHSNSQAAHHHAKAEMTSSSEKEATSTLPLYARLLLTLGVLLGSAGFLMGLISLLDSSNGSSGIASNSGNASNPDGDSTSTNTTSLLDQIVARGFVKCGLTVLQPGFVAEVASSSSGTTTTTTTASAPSLVGLDVDLCRAISSALFDGNADAYEASIFPFAQRWSKIRTNEADVVMRSTYTMERDVYLTELDDGLDFTTPYFYDGMIFGGLADFVACAETGYEDSFDNPDWINGTCADTRICVLEGTTWEQLVVDNFPELNIVRVSEPSQGQSLYSDDFPDNCNVMVAEQTGLSEAILRQDGYQGPYAIGTQLFSKEPISLVSRSGDPRWGDFLETVFQSLVHAEHEGITQATADDMPTFDLFGPEFSNMLRHAVRVTGNYGEMYDRHLEAFLPRRGPNLLNRGVEPMMLAFPFGNLQAVGPQIERTSPTVQRILEKGYVDCGNLLYFAFAAFDEEAQDYHGFAVDYCRAISAALFDGLRDRVVFTNVFFSNRFDILQAKETDLLTTITTWSIIRDVKEPGTGKGLTFSDSYAFFGSSFGGIPLFVDCADRLDVVTPECQALRICAFRGSTLVGELIEFLGRAFYIVEVGTFAEMVGGLRDGICNVIFTLTLNALETNVRANGYAEGPYALGNEVYSLEPLAVATREDDPLWADFCNWIVWALVYAEEEGITQATASRMPRPSIFGPRRTSAFYHAVNAVGNFGEIYERNFGIHLPRSEIHQLNKLASARHYALPGF